MSLLAKLVQHTGATLALYTCLAHVHMDGRANCGAGSALQHFRSTDGLQNFADEKLQTCILILDG